MIGKLNQKDPDVISHRWGIGGTVGEAAGPASGVHGDEVEDDVFAAADESDAFQVQNSGSTRIWEKTLYIIEISTSFVR